jgi:hypothetical protein
VNDPQSAPPKDVAGSRITLEQLGEWANSIKAIITLVILVAGGIAAVVSNHFTGWITGGGDSSGGATKVARITLTSPHPTAQDNDADTYTLSIGFQGYGDDCTITFQRFDSANLAIDRTPDVVPCEASGSFEQDVRVSVPAISTDWYRVRFKLQQGSRSFGHATTDPQYVP